MDISQAKADFSKTTTHLDEELKKIRAGRPSPEMFSSIKVLAYGDKQDLQTVGNISVVDATLVTVQVWDQSLIDEVIKGIQAAGNYNPQHAEGDLIRIPIPPMDQEKRKEIVKEVKQMAEDHKIQIRQARKDMISKLDNAKQNEGLPEDQYNRLEKQLQEEVDSANKKIDELVSTKEESLMQV